ncbi:hypothetical protein AVEN_200230-1 [Araneus ventricosus]|uniref:Uncharacterized protein n=1 Tax=Araneus ventricosus TaxID=182803 RepID=A0A4Y2U4F6_ARAVE|nr:hypothetical protein AVEN_200230-1 [Araneus ventricosus]
MPPPFFKPLILSTQQEDALILYFSIERAGIRPLSAISVNRISNPRNLLTAIPQEAARLAWTDLTILELWKKTPKCGNSPFKQYRGFIYQVS